MKKQNLVAKIESCILSGGKDGSSPLPCKPSINYCRLVFPAKENDCRFSGAQKVEDVSYGRHENYMVVFYCSLRNKLENKEDK